MLAEAFSLLIQTTSGQKWSFTCCVAMIVYLIFEYLQFRLVLKSIRHFPGVRTLIGVDPLINRVFDAIPGVLPGINYSWIKRYDVYKAIGWDVHSTVSVWPRGRVHLWLADADVIKEVTSSQTRFPKAVHLYKVLEVFGPNIISADFEDWKKFRKISRPAFSEKNDQYVWETTVKVITDIMENLCATKPVIEVNHGVEFTLPIALSVIAAAGFGSSIDFAHDVPLCGDHKMTFKDALHTVANNMWIKVALPNWAYSLHPSSLAFQEVKTYMRDIIHERRSVGSDHSRSDLLNLLLDANEDADADGSTVLTDDELLGNLFIFLLGGHEASAHTLCFALASLALYPEEQEKLYKQIVEVVPGDNVPTYGDISSLKLSLAVVYEALRMFPPVNVVPKYSATDTTLVAGNANGGKFRIPVPKDTHILIHTVGLHYNPRYWENPETFKPNRFLGDWPREAFMPFGSGSRACLGRRFFEMEATAALTMIVKHYIVEIKEEPNFGHETMDQKKARILQCRNILTLT